MHTLAFRTADAIAEKKQLVLEGVAEGRVNEEELQNPKVAINAVVTELMRQYPGRPNM